MRKIDMIEFIIVALSLLFAIVISLYHVSYDGYLGLSDKSWSSVWAISENGFSVLMSFIVYVYSYGIIRILFARLFIPYFLIKLVYHFSCFSGIYLVSTKTWMIAWSLMLVVIILVALLYCFRYIKKQRNVA